MALMKKLTEKVVKDVKETVAEEAKKTGKDVKRDILPVVAAFGVGILIACVFRRPQTIPVTVKVVLKTTAT